MTNTELLRNRITESGYKLNYIAAQCGISYQALLNKMNNRTQFVAREIVKLKTILSLTPEDCNRIFFSE